MRKGASFPKGQRGKLEVLLGAGSTLPDGLPSTSLFNFDLKSYNFTAYAGVEVYTQFQGKVVRVVKDWTPKSHDPNGNYVVVQTVEPDGLVFDIRYSHLLSDIKVKVGQYLSPEFQGYLGQGGHTGVPANQTTTFSITAWTPEFGGQYLPFGYYSAVSPDTIGTPPNFVDLDPNPDGTSDDPDNDVDDPGGYTVGPMTPTSS